MRFVTALVLLASSAFAQADRTEITVGFEYQLEVNKIERTGTTEDVMGNINSNIIGALQEALPNGGSVSDEELPNVKFASINSKIFSACFTKSEQCSLVRSDILVSYEGDKTEHDLEFVTLNLVQEYLTQYSKTNALVYVKYAYPSMVKTLTQFKMQIVNGRMTPTEVGVMESTFHEVFGAIVFAFEGDTDVVDAKFLYQDLFDVENVIEDNLFKLENNNTATKEEGNKPLWGEYVLTADLEIRGYCRDCISSEFGEIVNIAIVDNLPAFQNKLKSNGASTGSWYFENVTDVSFAVPELPSELPPIEDDTIFDTEAPVVETKNPWFLPFGITCAFVIIVVGAYVIYKDRADLDKEEFSTSESDVSYGSEVEEGEEYTNGEGTFELDDYQVETIANTEEGDGQNSKYEVYVF